MTLNISVFEEDKIFLNNNKIKSSLYYETCPGRKMKFPVAIQTKNGIKVARRSVKKVLSLLQGVSITYFQQSSVCNTVSQSSKSGCWKFIQSVPSHFMSFSTDIENYWT